MQPIPKLCPLSGHPSFDNHHNGCPHGEEYVTYCREFSSYFWHKVSKNQDLTNMPEEKLPQELIQNIYGKGREEWNNKMYAALEMTLDTLEISKAFRNDFIDKFVLALKVLE